MKEILREQIGKCWDAGLGMAATIWAVFSKAEIGYACAVLTALVLAGRLTIVAMEAYLKGIECWNKWKHRND